MTSPKSPVNQHHAYHAHVYFDASTLAFATALCQRIERELLLEVGRIHQGSGSSAGPAGCQGKTEHPDDGPRDQQPDRIRADPVEQ